MNRERYLVKSNGDNQEGTKVGVSKLIELLRDKYQSAVIVVPSIGQVKNTMLTTVLGEDLSKTLIKKKSINIGQSKTLSLCASSTLKNHKNSDAYLALWGTEKMIGDIEKLTACKAAVLVTWLPKDSEKWGESYSPTVIYDDKKS